MIMQRACRSTWFVLINKDLKLSHHIREEGKKIKKDAYSINVLRFDTIIFRVNSPKGFPTSHKCGSRVPNFAFAICPTHIHIPLTLCTRYPRSMRKVCLDIKWPCRMWYQTKTTKLSQKKKKATFVVILSCPMNFGIKKFF